MAVYKVSFVETLNDTTYSTHRIIRAPSKEVAKSEVIKSQTDLANKNYRNPHVEILILEITKTGSENDQILNTLWDTYPNIYMELWEPDIRTQTMIRKLEKQYPDTYKVLEGD